MRHNLADSQLKKLKHSLDERYSVLTESIRAELLTSTDEQHVKLAGRVHDTKDQSFAELVADVTFGRVQLHAVEINDINNAHQRLHAGTYGVCTDCDQPIGYERLMAYPTAKRCVRCQTAHEKLAL